jgi:hypothetical protein
MKILFLSFFLISLQSHALSVVQCAGQKPQILDLQESTTRYKLQLDTAHATSVPDRLHYLLGKLKKFNPSRAAQYQEWLQSFQPEYIAASESVGAASIPAGCDFKQLPAAPAVWNSLSVLQQAAAILHELIYRDFTQQESPHISSEEARVLNALVNSLEFNSYTLKKYLIRLQKLNVMHAEYGAIPILLTVRNEETKEWVPFFLHFYKGQLTHLVLDAAHKKSVLSGAGYTLTPVCGLGPARPGAPKAAGDFFINAKDGSIISVNSQFLFSDSGTLFEKCYLRYHADNGFEFLGNDFEFFNTLTAAPDKRLSRALGAGIFSGGPVPIFKSTDGGVTCYTLPSPGKQIWQYSRLLHPETIRISLEDSATEISQPLKCPEGGTP